MSKGKRTFSTELTVQEYDNFRTFLKANRIEYEPSACYGNVYISMELDEEEYKLAELFLSKLAG